MFLRPKQGAEEQVIFDIGISGSSPDRIQFFINLTGELIFRVDGNAITIPAVATETLTHKWMPTALQAKRKSKKLLLRISTPDFEWVDESAFHGPNTYGPQMRIGQALSSGRGIALEMLDLALLSGVQSKRKIKVLMEILSGRPSAFDLKHGMH